MPHTKYDTCKPKKQHTNSMIVAVLKPPAPTMFECVGMECNEVEEAVSYQGKTGQHY